MKRFGYILLLMLFFASSSCVKEIGEDEKTVENMALRAWILKNREDILGNIQNEGDYYVDIKKWGDMTTLAKGNDMGGEPIMDQDTCWMYFNFTGYDLDGNVCITRSERLARMQGKFSKRTHYVPYLNYCGDTNVNGLWEGSYLATRNLITLDDLYVQQNPECQGKLFRMRKDSKVWLYMPYTVCGGLDSNNGDGGYEGQFTLDTTVPMIMEMEVKRVIKNPSTKEIEMVDSMALYGNGKSGQTVWKKVEKPVDENESSTEEEDDPYYQGLYYNLHYTPEGWENKFSYCRPDVPGIGISGAYKDTDVYSDMATLELNINQILKNRFGDKAITPDKFTDENLVGAENTAKIWYVGRFLDGFVFDTNIKEIKNLVFGENEDGSAISYNAESDEKNYITAWYHCIPMMHYGQFAAIMTTSGFAYGTKGVTGSTSSSGSSDAAAYVDPSYYYDYSSYYDYYGYASSTINPYGYYNYSNYYGSASSSVDTSSISTEIQPYMPLLFYIFIEPKSKTVEE